MARSYANIITAIWNDPDFRALPSGAQRDYLMLVTQPNISAAGTLPLTIRRWAALASDTTAEILLHNFKVLGTANFIVVDDEAEELLVRSFVRHDNGYGNRKRRPVIYRAALETQSPMLRRALATEFARLGLATDGLSDGPSPPDGPAPRKQDVSGEPHEADNLATVTVFPQVNRLSDSPSDRTSTSNGVVGCNGEYLLPATRNPQPRQQADGQADDGPNGTETPVEPSVEGDPFDSTGPERGPVQNVDRLPHPRAGAQPPPNHVPDNPRPTYPLEAHQVISDGLYEAGEQPTAAEVRAVHSALVKGRFGAAPGLPLLRRFAAEGSKLPLVLTEVRAATKQARADEIARLRKQGAECPHRTPGGAEPHPTTGQPLCPECRAGVPAPAVIDLDPQAEYVRAWNAAHVGEIPWNLRSKIIRQIEHLRSRHAPEADIVALAIAAATHGTDLHTHVRSLADAS